MLRLSFSLVNLIPHSPQLNLTYFPDYIRNLDEIPLIQFYQGLSWADAGGPARGWAGLGRPARPDPPIFYMMGRGPARPAKFSEDGPRPGPAHQFFRGWATDRPSPSRFQTFTARPGLADHFLFQSPPGRARPITWQQGPWDTGCVWAGTTITWAGPCVSSY